MRRLMMVCVLMVACGAAVFAQDKPKDAPTVPVLSETDALKLDKIVLSDENLQMRIGQMQQELSKLREQAQAFVTTLQKAGYTLTRDPKTGAWQYAKAEEPSKAPEKK